MSKSRVKVIGKRILAVILSVLMFTSVMDWGGGTKVYAADNKLVVKQENLTEDTVQFNVKGKHTWRVYYVCSTKKLTDGKSVKNAKGCKNFQFLTSNSKKIEFKDLKPGTNYNCYFYAEWGHSGIFGSSQVVYLNVTTKQITPAFNSNPVLTGTYGDKVEDLKIKAPSSANGVIGKWKITDGNAKDIPTVGTSKSYKVTFTPNDNITYETVVRYVTPVISKRNITVKAQSQTRVYGSSNKEFKWEVSSDTPLVGKDNKKCLLIDLSTTANELSSVGEYDIIGTGTSDNYEITVESAKLIVVKKDSAITIADKSYEKTYGDAPFKLTGINTDGDGKLSYSVVDSKDVSGNDVDNNSVITVENGVVTVVNAGTAKIKVKITDSKNYNDKECEEVITVTVNKKKAKPISCTENYIYAVGSNGEKIRKNLSEYLPKDIDQVKYVLDKSAAGDFLDINYKENGDLIYVVGKGELKSTGIIKVIAKSRNYQDIVFTININLVDFPVIKEKEDAKVAIVGDNTLVYGEPLSKLVFNNEEAKIVNEKGEVVPGTIAWTSPEFVPTVGTPSAEWTFTPSDPTKYTTLTGELPINVIKATPVITNLPTVTNLVYNPWVKLDDKMLEGGKASVDGTWSFKEPNVVPTVDKSVYAVVFTPADTNNYNTVEQTINISVIKATPETLKLPVVADLVYDPAFKLEDRLLTGGLTTTEGTWSFKDKDVTPTVDKEDYIVVFTPNDTVNYNSFEKTIKINVAKATPTITELPTVTTFAYDSNIKLADLTLNGGKATVSGTFSFKDPEINPTVDQKEYEVVFTPADHVNYNIVTDIINIEVTKGTPVIKELPTVADMVYNPEVTLTDSMITGGDVSTGGKWSFEEDGIVPSVAQKQYKIVFTPDDNTNYSTAEGIVKINVAKATPTITEWPTVEERVYNPKVKVDNNMLIGGNADVGGTWSFKDPETIPSVDQTDYTVVFTPTDEDNYKTVEGPIKIGVIKATPTITEIPTVADRVYDPDVTLKDVELKGGKGSVDGTFSFKEEKANPTVDKSEYTVVFTPDDEINYNTVETTVKFNVTKATPEIKKVPTVADLVYDPAAKLEDSMLKDGSASVKGEWSFKVPDVVPTVKQTEYTVVFTPDDEINYNTVETTVKFNVTKATPEIKELPTVKELEYNATVKLADVQLDGGKTSVKGTWSFKDKDLTPTTDRKDYTVIFTPEDTDNYNTVEKTIQIIVKNKPEENKKTVEEKKVVLKSKASSVKTGDTNEMTK